MVRELHGHADQVSPAHAGVEAAPLAIGVDESSQPRVRGGRGFAPPATVTMTESAPRTRE